MKKYILFLGWILLIITSCSSQSTEIKNISVEDLQVVLKDNKNTQLVDVRTSTECAKGIIENAIKIDVKESDFEKIALDKLDKTKPVYLYCRSGVRSKKASKLLLKKGFQTYNVLGGYIAWKQKKQLK